MVEPPASTPRRDQYAEWADICGAAPVALRDAAGAAWSAPLQAAFASFCEGGADAVARRPVSSTPQSPPGGPVPPDLPEAPSLERIRGVVDDVQRRLLRRVVHIADTSVERHAEASDVAGVRARASSEPGGEIDRDGRPEGGGGDAGEEGGAEIGFDLDVAHVSVFDEAARADDQLKDSLAEVAKAVGLEQSRGQCGEDGDGGEDGDDGGAAADGVASRPGSPPAALLGAGDVEMEEAGSCPDAMAVDGDGGSGSEKVLPSSGGGGGGGGRGGRAFGVDLTNYTRGPVSPGDGCVRVQYQADSLSQSSDSLFPSEDDFGQTPVQRLGRRSGDAGDRMDRAVYMSDDCGATSPFG